MQGTHNEAGWAPWVRLHASCACIGQGHVRCSAGRGQNAPPALKSLSMSLLTTWMCICMRADTDGVVSKQGWLGRQKAPNVTGGRLL